MTPAPHWYYTIPCLYNSQTRCLSSPSGSVLPAHAHSVSSATFVLLQFNENLLASRAIERRRCTPRFGRHGLPGLRGQMLRFLGVLGPVNYSLLWGGINGPQLSPFPVWGTPPTPTAGCLIPRLSLKLDSHGQKRKLRDAGPLVSTKVPDSERDSEQAFWRPPGSAAEHRRASAASSQSRFFLRRKAQKRDHANNPKNAPKTVLSNPPPMAPPQPWRGFERQLSTGELS